ncbi:hypothetical protein [Verrucosispora sioxanthis]|uniref:hypothetical protein n=1 Tax=Verrucosispora sioxanthis TaxID=2499994 RepID=UPI00209D41E5|nr:hypothetical protein [Verrucosispora sioxanthis]
MLDLARSALPQVAQYAQVDAVIPVGPDLFEIRSAGRHPLTVRLSSGPLADGLVARSTRDPDGVLTVTVSDRAAEPVVARALAHEVAEPPTTGAGWRRSACSPPRTPPPTRPPDRPYAPRSTPSPVTSACGSATRTSGRGGRSYPGTCWRT